jgi:hypothetical protein
MPEVTKEQLAEAVRADVRKQLGWDEAQEWQYREVPDEYTAEELERVTALQAQWTACAAGREEAGWNGMRPSRRRMETASTTSTRTKQVRESKEARKRRLHQLNEEIAERAAKRVDTEWKQLLKAEGIIARLGK